MELQFQSGTCRCLKAAAREVRNAELTQEVRLSDGMPDIGRVLASWGQVILRSKEWQGDLVTVSGGIMVWILYVPEDDTPPRCVDAWVPFQIKWELGDSGKEGAIRVFPLLRFVDSRNVSARKLMIRAGIAAMGEALSPVQNQIYSPSEVPEDIQLLQNTYPIRLSKEAGEKTFLLDEELQIPAGCEQPERLLAYTINPQIYEKRVSGDKMIVRGAGKVWVLYRCAEGKIHTTVLEIPFAQYAQLEDTYGNDAQADVMMGATSLELTHNEGSQIRVKCGLVAQYLITDRYLAAVAEDAYSTMRDVKLHMEELEVPSVLEQRAEVVQAHQQISGLDADVVGVSFLADFPRQNRMGDKVTLDYSGQYQLLYYAPDGSLQGTTARWEHAAQLGADPKCSLCFLVQPSSDIQASAGTEELSLNCQLKVEMYVHTQEKISMASGLEIGQQYEQDPNRPTLILCRSEGDSLWNIAKRCGSTVDEILRVNHLEGQPEPDKMLLIPVS